jgi:hypothetical protein
VIQGFGRIIWSVSHVVSFNVRIIPGTRERLGKSTSRIAYRRPCVCVSHALTLLVNRFLVCRRFYDFYIIPLAKKLSECGVFGISSDEYLGYAQKNRDEWVAKGREVVAGMVEKYTAEFMTEL